MKQFFIIAAVTFLSGFTFLVVTQSAHATKQPWQICGEGLHVGNPHCVPSITVSPTEEISPEPTLEITPEVTEEPTASPTAEITQTPTTNSGGDNHGDNRSDGRHTAPDGLGCAVHECKAIPQAPPNAGKGR